MKKRIIRVIFLQYNSFEMYDSFITSYIYTIYTFIKLLHLRTIIPVHAWTIQTIIFNDNFNHFHCDIDDATLNIIYIFWTMYWYIKIRLIRSTMQYRQKRLPFILFLIINATKSILHLNWKLQESLQIPADNASYQRRIWIIR